MAALALPPSTVTFTGAVGVLSGMAVTAAEAADQPTSLRAERVKEYILPFFKPVIRHLVDVPQDCSPLLAPLHLTR